MKRVLALICCLVLLTGCASTPEPEEVQAVDFYNYQYRYENQRDLGWEEDIVFFAQTMLGTDTVDGQPYLTKNEVEIMPDAAGDRSTSEYRSLFNEQMHREFTESVSKLIDQIPELTDMQIQYELRRIVCALEDCHSQVLVEQEAKFPLTLECLEADGELGLYAVCLPDEYGHLIFCKLIAINDIPIREVFEKMSPYLEGESAYGALAMFANVTKGNYISRKEALQAAGIMGLDETTARFRFETEYGEKEITLEAFPIGERPDDFKVTDLNHVIYGFYSWHLYLYEDYFYDYVPEDDTLYIRLYSIPGAQSGQLSGFIANIKKLVREQGGVSKTILDLRDNGGGTPGSVKELTEFLTDPLTGTKYILINEASFSAAVSIPYQIRTESEKAYLVGSPAAQAPNSPYHNNQLYTMKNSGLKFYYSMGYVNMAPEYEYDTLTPDVLIYQTLDDYIRGFDTVLDAVWNMKE